MSEVITLRQMAVTQPIAALPVFERELIISMSEALSNIYLYTMTPFMLGLIGIPLGVLTMLLSLPESLLSANENSLSALIIVSSTVGYLLTVLLMKIFFFNRKRDQEIKSLRLSFKVSPDRERVQVMLKEVEPEMEQKIRKYL